MKKAILTKVIPLSIAAVSTLGFAASAHAMSFKISGHIDRALTFASNGKQSGIGQVDNIGSNSRFRFTGEQAMNNGMKLGFIYELGIDKNGSTTWDIGNNNGSNSNHFNVRMTEAYLKGHFGTFSFGRGNSAASYIETINLSGTAWIGGGVWYELYSSSISFVDDSGQVVTNVGSTQSPFNTITRSNRIRYDTPSLNGLVFSASYSQGNAYALAGRYNATFAGGIKFAAGLGYSDTESANINHEPGTWALSPGSSRLNRLQTIAGSASVLFPNGLNFTLSGGRLKQQVTGDSANNLFASIGYTVGKNHFAVNYGQTKDYFGLVSGNQVSGSKGSQIGLAYVYDWTHSVALYASFHHYMLTLPDSYKVANGIGSIKGINQVYVGTLIKFL